jgi:aspartate racemase
MDLWRKILVAGRSSAHEALGDLAAPRVSIESVPELGLSMSLERWQSEVWAALEPAVKRLAARNDVICVACNTLHHFEPQLATALGTATLVSYPGTAARIATAVPESRLGLLAVRPVVSGGPWSAYRRLSVWDRFELPRDPDRIHLLVERIKCQGSDDPSVAQEFAEICKTFDSKRLLLACTELPLVAVTLPEKELIDLTAEVACRAVQLALAFETDPCGSTA